MLHKIFAGRKKVLENEMRASMITGGAVTLGLKLQQDHGWNGTSLLALVHEGFYEGCDGYDGCVHGGEDASSGGGPGGAPQEPGARLPGVRGLHWWTAESPRLVHVFFSVSDDQD